MAGSKKQAYQVSVLEELCGIDPAADLWLALYTVLPTSTAAGTEVADGGYARQPVNFAAVTPGSPSSSTSNDADLDFGASVGVPFTVVGFAICDAVSGGNQIYVGPMTNFVVSTGIPIHVAAGACAITET